MIDTTKLKEKILDLAIRGKLVPQDPNDEPASVLLEKIRKEKLQMVKDGKLKQKDIKDDSIIFVGDDNLHYEKFADGSVKCIENEIPFEIPKSWAWCRVNTICYINPKNSVDDNLQVSFIPMTLISDSYANYHSQEIKVWSQIKKGFTHFSENDIGIAKITPCFENRKSVIFKNLKNGLGAGTTELFVLRPVNNIIIEYIFWNIKTNRFIQGGVQTYTGDVGQQRIQKNYISKYLIPLPPTKEQQRIVEIVKNLLLKIKFIESNCKGMFDSISSLKSKILDLAIRGKLVPQDPNDEPADVLLERIRKEKEELIKQGKIKRDKKESVIFKGDDNSYYEKIGSHIELINDFKENLPTLWNICRLGNIANIFTGNSINEEEKSSKYVNLKDGFDYIGTKDISFNNIINYDNGVKIPFNTTFKIAPANTSLLCIEGGSAGRKIAITTKDVCFGNKLCAFQSLGVLPKYLYYYLQSPQFLQSFQTNTSGLIGGVSINTIKQLYFKIPPIQEQLRVVNAIEKIFFNINQIEKSLN